MWFIWLLKTPELDHKQTCCAQKDRLTLKDSDRLWASSVERLRKTMLLPHSRLREGEALLSEGVGEWSLGWRWKQRVSTRRYINVSFDVMLGFHSRAIIHWASQHAEAQTWSALSRQTWTIPGQGDCSHTQVISSPLTTWVCLNTHTHTRIFTQLVSSPASHTLCLLYMHTLSVVGDWCWISPRRLDRDVLN